METHPVVLRFKEMYPAALGRMKMHAARSGGPLENIETEFSKRNRVYVGEDFAKEVRTEIAAMQEDNLREEVAALRKVTRKAQADRRQLEGLKDPWKSSQNGPLREVVLTAKVDHFAAEADADPADILITYGQDRLGNTVEHRLSKAKIAAFETRALAFFEEYFPGAVRHLRMDLDEETPHIHALIMQTVVKTSERRGRQVLIQPSANPLLKSYEFAQDLAGAHFAGIGLARGKARASEIRAARAAGKATEAAPEHTSPRQFREERALKIREAEISAELDRVAAAEARADGQAKAEAADDLVRSATKQTAKAEAVKAAMTEGMAALEDERLAYRPATAEKEEGLKFGAKAPADREERAGLARLVAPAYDWLVGVARRFHDLRQRFAAAKREQAEVRRRAQLVEAEARKLNTRVAPEVRDAGRGITPERYTAASFPGAWAIPEKPDTKDLQRQLDAIDNRTLRQRYVATRDAWTLCEDQPELRGQFHRGAHMLAHWAKLRGLDLETGVHHPERAEDATRARLHIDSEAPVLPMRTERQRQGQRVRG